MTIKTNQFKDSKPKKEKKTAPESNPGEQFKRLTGFISSTRFTLSVGIIFLFIAIFLLLAFTSYYLTWTTDDNKVSGDFWSVVFSNNSGNAADPVKNWMGAIGVFAAAFFIKEWFGLAAFLIPVFFNIPGIQTNVQDQNTAFLPIIDIFYPGNYLDFNFLRIFL